MRPFLTVMFATLILWRRLSVVHVIPSTLHITLSTLRVILSEAKDLKPRIMLSGFLPDTAPKPVPLALRDGS